MRIFVEILVLIVLFIAGLRLGVDVTRYNACKNTYTGQEEFMQCNEMKAEEFFDKIKVVE